MSIHTYIHMYAYIKSDYIRYGRQANLFKMILEVLIGLNPSFSYTFWMRLGMEKNLFYPLARLMLYRLSRKHGISISYAMKIGYGFYIGHGCCGCVINSTAVIGNNCNISQFVTIGGNTAKDGSKCNGAIIGDNVYIGPSVCIVGNVKIGNNVTIGAGSVVTKDIPDNATVAGVPAKIISYDNPGRFVNRRCKLE